MENLRPGPGRMLRRAVAISVIVVVAITYLTNFSDSFGGVLSEMLVVMVAAGLVGALVARKP